MSIPGARGRPKQKPCRRIRLKFPSDSLRKPREIVGKSMGCRPALDACVLACNRSGSIPIIPLTNEASRRDICWHVHRHRAEPRLAAGHPAAGRLPRGRAGQEPHPRQSQRVAARQGRVAAPRVAGRTPGPRRPTLRRGGLSASRPRAGRPHRDAAAGLRGAPRVPALARAGPRGGHGRRPDPRAREQAGHHALVAHHHPPRRPRGGRRGRGRLLRGAGLAARAASSDRAEAGGPAPPGGRRGALRSHLELLRRDHLPPGRLRP